MRQSRFKARRGEIIRSRIISLRRGFFIFFYRLLTRGVAPGSFIQLLRGFHRKPLSGVIIEADSEVSGGKYVSRPNPSNRNLCARALGGRVRADSGGQADA